MEIDMGASLSLVSEQTYQELWPSVPLQSTSVNKPENLLRHSIKSTRLNDVEVCYEQQAMTLPLLVVAGIGASLLGRNWLEKITLNWKAIHAVHIDKLQEVLDQYSE